MNKNDVLVFSIALEGYSGLFRSCIKSQREYCARSNFDYVLIDKTPRTLLPTEAAWLKLFLLRSALESDYKWIGFIDADCEVRIHAPSFVQELEKSNSGKSIFMAHGFSGRINSGVIFMKNSKESLEYLEKVIQNGDDPVTKEDKALYENGHMIHYGKNNPNVQIIESAEWNNNISINKQSYIQHYSGGKLRMKYMEAHPVSKYKYLIMKKIRKMSFSFSSKKATTSMNDINSLLPFYHKAYPMFTGKK